ncbi:ComEA family DNA-binding protein [Neisseria sp. Ec49-e6-T10]|uniref:ComEA family DNA-binding protein n=1 Tax=Neisseria sp. Ec49-e6-T10 TaxID=3140744 RepID=UPI003EB9F4F0
MLKKIIGGLLMFLCMSMSFAVVNINSATEEELSTLKGVGPAKAKAIVVYRIQNGAFKSTKDLQKVKGIGEKTYDGLKNDITINDDHKTKVRAVKNTNQKTKEAKPVKKVNSTTRSTQ